MHEWYFLTGLFMTLIIFLWEILLLYYAWLFVRSLDLGLSPATDKENAKGTRRRRNTMRDDAHIEEEGEELARDETTLGDFEDADPEDLLLSSLGRETSGSATGRTTSPLPSSPPLHSEWPSFVPVSGPETMLGRTIARKASKGTLRLRRPRSSIALPGGFHARVPSGSKSGPSFPPSEVLDDAEEVNGGEAYAVPFDTAPPTEVLDTGLPTADSTTEHHEHLLLHLEKIESVNYWRESLPTAVEGEETPLAEHVHAATLASSLDPGLGTDDTVLSPPESATTSHHPDELMEKKDESMLEPTLAVLDSVDLEIATTGKDGAMRHRHTKKQKQQNQNTGDGTKKEEEVAPEDITIPSLDEASDDTELTPSE